MRRAFERADVFRRVSFAFWLKQLALDHLRSSAVVLDTVPTETMCSAGMDTVTTGTKMYMGLYPENSTDSALRLGNICPDFSAETTQGPMPSFHEWKKDSWAILFSHPADFTPVCTTEIGRLALKYDELTELGCKLATLSVDPVKSHEDFGKGQMASALRGSLQISCFSTEGLFG